MMPFTRLGNQKNSTSDERVDQKKRFWVHLKFNKMTPTSDVLWQCDFERISRLIVKRKYIFGDMNLLLKLGLWKCLASLPQKQSPKY